MKKNDIDENFAVMISHLRKTFIKSIQILIIHIQHYVMCYFYHKIIIVENDWKTLLFVVLLFETLYMLVVLILKNL